jgi:rhodanese-related sulfurtransferase
LRGNEAAGHIPGAVHILNTELRQHGYRVANLSGGLTTYRVATEKQNNLDA